MKTKKIILIIFLLVNQFAISQNIDINGYVRNYTGILYDKGDFSILQNTLNLDFTKSGNKVAFKANPILYSYNTDSLDFRLREIYVDLYFKNFDLRIGKQQIIWGKADGAFITDIVSPLNLTEFLLPDFDEIRRGVNVVKFDYYLGNNTFEIIWIPNFTPTKIPAVGSIWYIQTEFLLAPTFDWSKSEIIPSLKNSEIFFKYSALTSKVDIEIMGGYTFDDKPSMHKNLLLDTLGNPSLLIKPEYHRLFVSGGSFSSEIKGIVLRGEAAFYNGKYFQTEDPFAIDALVQKDYLHYLIGLDFIIGNVNFSTQFIQETILNYDNNMFKEKTENTATFLARYNMFRETLHFELFTYIGLTNEDALIRPKITYDFDDSFSILFGSNIFIGDKKGRFGQYKDNSMAYIKLKYSF